MSLRSRVAERAAVLLDYCRREGYNTHIALFVDLSRHSGRRRFVVWDFESEDIVVAAPVSHGSGSRSPHVRSAYARMSNEDGSHLSSVGRALVAERYVGCYGTAYRLDGLDSTNSNLRSRCVVLHGWDHTTSYPIYPFATVGSFGCPVLSRRVMEAVDGILCDHKRVIIDIFV
ncbi:MAG: murein L,D-transpeptidase catalytic domain family protein [Alistipes sp.]|nr:murein L,D-transpeptidase catalytic domain family protein [Alistipes sp.]